MSLIEKNQNRAEKNQRVEESRSEEICQHEPIRLVETLARRNERNIDETELPQNDRTRNGYFPLHTRIKSTKRSVRRKQ